MKKIWVLILNVAGLLVVSNPLLATPGGPVIFDFNTTLPEIICSPGELCDIEFEANEIPNAPLLLDKKHWLVVPTTSGTGDQKTAHAVISPSKTGISTTMIIATDRRTYHLHLTSRETGSMPKISFRYDLAPSVSFTGAIAQGVTVLPEQEWKIKKTESLEENLVRWGKEATPAWNVLWKAPFSQPIDAGITVEGTFYDAISFVFDTLERSGSRLTAVAHDHNHTLVIEASK